ncbi:MAG: AAA family ATPase [Alphaproteobacteria bacterium]|nr:AAA family ATPase [Alphaproteobacteria bacterium]
MKVRGQVSINIHVLIDPTDPKHVAEIELALKLLVFEYNEQPYSCDEDGLERLGRAHDPRRTDKGGAFKHGVNNFKPDFSKFREWYEKQRWLKENSLVVLANGKDGPSGLSKDAGFAATRDELYRFAHFIFSGNPKDRAYFLGLGTDGLEEVVRKCGGLKPCIHGSDAHDAARLFLPDQKRFCWVKADVTFEGLRQLQFEPEHRVFIGPTPPAPIDQSKVIRALRVAGGDSWFTTKSIDLNAGLVGIIGEKGSGKTALAELLAFAGSAWKGEKSSSSFIAKAGKRIGDVGVTLEWADKRTSSRKLSERETAATPEVRYLSQDFVEELCSRDLSGSALVRQIEEVIFSYIDEADRLDASSFEVLRRIKTETIHSRKDALTARIGSLNREIVDLQDQLTSRGAKLEATQKLDADIAAIDAQLPMLQSTVDSTVAEKLKRLTELQQQKAAQLAATNRRVARINTVRERAVDYAASLEAAFLTLKPLLEEVGLSAEEVDAFRPKLSDTRAAPFAALSAAALGEAKSLKGDEANPNLSGETIADINVQLTSLKATLASDEQQRLRLLALQDQRAKAIADKERLAKEIARLDTKVAAAIKAKADERLSEYLTFFGLMQLEAEALAELYAPLSKVIAQDETGAQTGFELNVRQVASTNDWIEVGRELFDKRRKVPLSDDTLAKLDASLFEGWKTGDVEAIRTGISEVLLALGNSPTDIDQRLVTHATRERVYEWAFNTDHVTLEYGLRYRGSELEVLSPGTRGIVLLVLYLAMDVQDRRPLIIDQPEGNLDNSSVYEALVPFLRKAKLARQIILVSHNPNLVVTADADQVIVATAARSDSADHPTLAYTSGSLEHTGTEVAIRAQTVRLLEGGSKPFKKRETRYSLPKNP